MGSGGGGGAVRNAAAAFDYDDTRVAFTAFAAD
jgi:hypothetical protein